MTNTDMDWIVSCRDPFIDVVVNAATKQDAAIDVLSDKKYVNFNLEKLRTLILEGKEEGYYVEQFSVFPKKQRPFLPQTCCSFSARSNISSVEEGKSLMSTGAKCTR